MRYVVIIGLALLAGILIRIKSEYRNRFLICFGAAAVLMSGLYYYRLFSVKQLIPFYRPVNQTFYQTEFLEKGEYPDSLLMLLFKDKTVYAKDDAYLLADAEKHNKYFMYAYYHAKSMYFFLEYAQAALIKDPGMNDHMVGNSVLEEDFTELGNVNDMFRYCFMYNDFTEEAGNYFSYYWYYYELMGPLKAYLYTGTDSEGNTVFTADELVVMWNTVDGVEEEDIYVMTRDYYDKNIGSEVAHNE